MESNSVFEKGDMNVTSFSLKQTSHHQLPEMLILTPVAQNVGSIFPLLLFFHGFPAQNIWYSQLLEHVSSHGYIVVAPQFHMELSNEKEVEQATLISEWLLEGGLSSVEQMPENVEADLSKVVVSGHSKGGKTAFALALALPPLKFSAVVGIDPVSGISPSIRTDPQILTYVPRSFDLSTPIAIIGTGLGNQYKMLSPPFAPNGVNHAEFWNESKPPCCYFLAKEYGHCDMLNDNGPPWWLMNLICQTGSGPRELMRRGVGGIVVAFLKAYLGGDKQDLQQLADGSLVAPITFHPVICLDNTTC